MFSTVQQNISQKSNEIIYNFIKKIEIEITNICIRIMTKEMSNLEIESMF